VRIIKNGCTRNGKQNRKCKDCGSQFVEGPQNNITSEATKDLIDKLSCCVLTSFLLLEQIPQLVRRLNLAPVLQACLVA
jgi:transposase-like protein